MGKAEAPTKADLVALGGIETMEADLYTKLADLIKPLTEQIIQLNLSVQAMAKLVERAMDLSIAQQDDIRALQKTLKVRRKRLLFFLTDKGFFN